MSSSAHARKWIALIVGLLGSMVVANALLIGFALSGGGAQPIPDAYEKALKWDETHPPRGQTPATVPASAPAAALPSATEASSGVIQPAMAGSTARHGS